MLKIASVRGDLSGEIDYSAKTAHFEGKQIVIPEIVFSDDSEVYSVLGLANEERWIEVDLSDQKLYAWEGDKLFLETLISTGLPWFPTPTGEFRIWIKLRATKMEGGSGRLYYYLPNVPYVMYFGNSEVPNWRGYGLHGTYWHNDFGHQHSHGCVNLPTEIAKELYYWTGPSLPEGKSTVWASDTNPGTRIVIHE
jgi:lipoprotein-anchoring transpeptidase ErfK/SrfK